MTAGKPENRDREVCAYIAFYGTLRSGTAKYKELELDKYLLPVGLCEIEGDLYYISTGAEEYPALVHGPGRAKAEVFKIVDPSILSKMDAYEEIQPEDPENSLYLRRVMHIDMPDGGKRLAWVYAYNQTVAGRQKIESGDWIDFMKKRAVVPVSAVSGSFRRQA